MTVDQQITVGGVLVLADARADDRSPRHRRKPSFDPRARTRNRLRSRRAIIGIGIDGRSVLVDPDLEAGVLDLGNPVNTRRTIDPCGRMGVSEAIVARRCAEVDNRLASGPDPAGQRWREHRRQPRATREHKGIAAHLAAAGQADRAKSPRRRRDDRLPAQQPRARSHELRCQRAHGATRHQDAAVRFQQRHRGVAGFEMWISMAQCRRLERVHGISTVLEGLPGCNRIRIAAVGQQQHAAGMPDGGARTFVQRPPLPY